jgi:hypothetical protein
MQLFKNNDNINKKNTHSMRTCFPQDKSNHYL